MPEEKEYFSKKRPRQKGIVAWKAEKKTKMVLTKEEKKRKKNYSFTVNNYSQQTIDQLTDLYSKNQDVIRYLVFGKEVGEKGTPHLQGHIDLLREMSISALQKLTQKFVEKHFTYLPMIISADHSRGYAKKDGDFTELGSPPEQGKRTDLTGCMDYCRENPDTPLVQLYEMFPSVFSRYASFIDKYRLMIHRQPTLHWTYPPNMFVFGPPGTGKSRYFQCMSSLYRKDANKWWCGYQNERNVLIEDVDPESCRRMARFFKIWLDRYPFTAQVKGSAIVIRPERVFITSNYSIDNLFSYTDALAIKRRVIEYEHFGGKIVDKYLVRKFVKIFVVSSIYITCSLLCK